MSCPNRPGRPARRFTKLDERLVLGRLVPVAAGPTARLLGLAFLDRDRAGAGLLLERCNAIHTFGMRFPVDVFFLDSLGSAVRVELGVAPRRLRREPLATAVLEVPSLIPGAGDGSAGGHPPAARGTADSRRGRRLRSRG